MNFDIFLLKYHPAVTNEDGTTEEKDRGFAKVGDYKVNLTYKDETKTVKVVVKDTTAPEMTVPENIEILQGTAMVLIFLALGSVLVSAF